MSGISAATPPERLAGLLAPFGVSGRLERLGGTGETYRIVTDAREDYVLKVFDDSTPPGLLDAQDSLAAGVDAFAHPVQAPRCLRTADGAVEVAVSAADGRGHDGRNRRVRVYTFVPGTPWREAGPAGPSRLRKLGWLIGRLGQLARRSSAIPDVARRTHDWDLTAAAQHRRRVPFVPEARRRAILDRAFMAHAAVLPQLASMPHGFIHGDVNDENVLVEGHDIVGLIDFGDALANPIVCDLAIGLAYAMLGASDPLQTGAEVVAGYAGERPLSVDEARVLLPLVRGRLAVTVAMAAERRTIAPDHPTWFVTEPAAWRLLERLDEVEPARAGTRLAAPAGVDPFPERRWTTADLRARRDAHVSRALSVSYVEPLCIVRGNAQYLIGHEGRPYLDLVNNVCHVGHGHPRVVEAGQRQMAVLNTNTRYLSALLPAYAERLAATLPDGLDVCFFVNSGSEANELALRLAAAHTGRQDVIVGDAAYHGNTPRLIALSAYKFLGPGGSGRPEPWVHLAPTPDAYRGPRRGWSRDTGVGYGDDVGAVARACANAGTPVGAFLTESLPSCGGQIVPPPGYLETAFRHVRAAGGVCIVDEVQTGFGRVGPSFWGFALQDVVPDIVVLGKPIGNGHPIGAVVTTRAIAASFENGMEFFSSFGGNPVSCAMGLAVLDVVRDEALPERARDVGTRLLDGLRALMDAHPLVGDVRGEGLFIGVELVRDRSTLEPAGDEAGRLVNRLRARGLLLSTDGPHHNVIKIKPPMVLTPDDADLVVRVMEEELTAS
ncbi:MAG: aminotransferase class III-fold pyridoxal phosphate-dependent enzyme [Vicinamibacterales bacterium]